ncbi:protein PIGBOS1 [Girardinichthys multiradiatus]|uniref:protein PIGBOS1 n=1 Tax=Girardinichthys multiradiatus TaxID=208333 RepID=UPI001FAB56A1|nr:protein PIGBOS1 [Girardinichthys multiradiatus]XP_047219613.1 protein PIGBOS1 [Girardinichthys multiradiatus]XP_047219614.1 protein PIGBOS1 [Girardinichthys multiradiatus]
MFRRRLPFSQLILAAVLGVAGGIYIYRPYFESRPKAFEQQNQDVPKKGNETDRSRSPLPGSTSQTEQSGPSNGGQTKHKTSVD